MNFKNNIIRLSVNALFVVALIYLALQQTIYKQKIAYIDSNKVFNGYKGIELAKAQFQKKENLSKQRMDTLVGRIKMDLMNMEKFRSDPSKYKRYVDSAEYDKRQYRDYGQATQQSLKEEEGKLTQNAIEKLNAFLKEYGKRKNYDLILIANSTGTIAYAQDKYDITDEVLKEINKQYDENN